MNLYDALENKNYKIVSINLTYEIFSRITNLGFFVGGVVSVVKSATKTRPILINSNGLNVALGEDISKNIGVSLSE